MEKYFNILKVAQATQLHCEIKSYTCLCWPQGHFQIFKIISRDNEGGALPERSLDFVQGDGEFSHHTFGGKFNLREALLDYFYHSSENFQSFLAIFSYLGDYSEFPWRIFLFRDTLLETPQVGNRASLDSNVNCSLHFLDLERAVEGQQWFHARIHHIIQAAGTTTKGHGQLGASSGVVQTAKSSSSATMIVLRLGKIIKALTDLVIRIGKNIQSLQKSSLYPPTLFSPAGSQKPSQLQPMGVLKSLWAEAADYFTMVGNCRFKQCTSPACIEAGCFVSFHALLHWWPISLNCCQLGKQSKLATQLNVRNKG